MIKTVFFYIFYISCVNATFNLRHLTYATGMEGHHRYLSVKEKDEFANVYDSYY